MVEPDAMDGIKRAIDAELQFDLLDRRWGRIISAIARLPQPEQDQAADYMLERRRDHALHAKRGQ